MKLRKASIAGLGLVSWLTIGVAVTTGCTAADTVSTAHKSATGGSAGAGTSGSGGTDTGTGGASSTGVGGTSEPNGGSVTPGTGGAGGDAVVMPPDASSTGETD